MTWACLCIPCTSTIYTGPLAPSGAGDAAGEWTNIGNELAWTKKQQQRQQQQQYTGKIAEDHYGIPILDRDILEDRMITVEDLIEEFGGELLPFLGIGPPIINVHYEALPTLAETSTDDSAMMVM